MTFPIQSSNLQNALTDLDEIVQRLHGAGSESHTLLVELHSAALSAERKADVQINGAVAAAAQTVISPTTTPLTF